MSQNAPSELCNTHVFIMQNVSTCEGQKHIRVTTSVSGLAKKVAGHQGLQLKKVVGPDEKL